jgi:hypothetical protein
MFQWSTNVEAAELSLNDGIQVLTFEGTAFDDSMNQNKWRIPEDEWDGIIQQIKNGIKIQKDHNPSVDATIGKTLDAWKDTINGTKVVRFKAESIDPNINIKIMKGYLNTVSIAGNAGQMLCAVCGKMTKPIKTCRHKEGEDVRQLVAQEMSFVTDPAYKTATITPISFSACVNCFIDDRDKIENSLSNGDNKTISEVLAKYPEDYRKEVYAFIASATNSNFGTGDMNNGQTALIHDSPSQITSISGIATSHPQGTQVAGMERNPQVISMSTKTPAGPELKANAVLQPAGGLNNDAVVVLGKFEETVSKMEKLLEEAKKREDEQFARKRDEEEQAKKAREDEEARKKMENTISSKMEEVISKFEGLFTKMDSVTDSYKSRAHPGVPPTVQAPSGYSQDQDINLGSKGLEVAPTKVPTHDYFQQTVPTSESNRAIMAPTHKLDEARKLREAADKLESEAKMEANGVDPHGPAGAPKESFTKSDGNGFAQKIGTVPQKAEETKKGYENVGARVDNSGDDVTGRFAGSLNSVGANGEPQWWSEIKGAAKKMGWNTVA